MLTRTTKIFRIRSIFFDEGEQNTIYLDYILREKGEISELMISRLYLPKIAIKKLIWEFTGVFFAYHKKNPNDL